MVDSEAEAFSFNSRPAPETHHFARAPLPGFLSVIIPVYLDVKGLEDTLETLARQTLPASRFEVIVANDGGEEVISRLCAKFNTAEVVIRPNQGAYVARNAALAQSRGEYIAFTDADVFVDPDWCLRGIEAMERFHIVAGETRLIPREQLDACQLFQLANYFPSENLIKSRMAQTVNTFIRREVFEANPWFDGRLRSGGDIEFSDRVGMNPAYVFFYEPKIKAKHPTRTKAQLIGSLKRIVFGQLNVYYLSPSRRRVLAPLICETYRLVFPPLRLYATDLSHLKLTMKDHIALFFFCWWDVKLHMFFFVLEAWWAWINRPSMES